MHAQDPKQKYLDLLGWQERPEAPEVAEKRKLAAETQQKAFGGVAPEEIIASKGPITAGNVDYSAEKLIPFVGSGAELYGDYQAWESAKALERGDITPEQATKLHEWMTNRTREKTFGATAAETAFNLPAYALEFLIGGAGSAKLMGAAAKTAMGQAVKETVERTIAKGAHSAAGRFIGTGFEKYAASGAAGVAGEALVGKAAGDIVEGGIKATLREGVKQGIATATMPQRVVSEGIARGMNESLQLTVDDQMLLTSKLPELSSMLDEGFMSMYAENLSEVTGGALKGLPVLAQLDLLQKATIGEYLKRIPGSTTANVLDRLRKGAKWNDLIGEMGEEHFASVLKSAMLGDPISNVWPGWKTELGMMAGFAIPAGIGVGLRTGAGLLADTATPAPPASPPSPPSAPTPAPPGSGGPTPPPTTPPPTPPTETAPPPTIAPPPSEEDVFGPLDRVPKIDEEGNVIPPETAPPPVVEPPAPAPEPEPTPEPEKAPEPAPEPEKTPEEILLPDEEPAEPPPYEPPTGLEDEPAPEEAPEPPKARTLTEVYEEEIEADPDTKKDYYWLERTARKATDGTGYLTKQREEAFEAAQARVADRLVKEGGARSFDRLRKLYETQPNLAQRTTTSKENQAYSTPLPLAFIARKVAKLTGGERILEPTAGTGALLIGHDKSKVVAVEKNAERAELLRRLGIGDVKEGDFLETNIEGEVDAVIANPPFGTKEGVTHKVKLGEFNFKTDKIDHAIAAKALESLSKDGKAVLIIGGKQGKGVEPELSRKRQYNSDADRAFFVALFDTFNVTKMFTVDGDLYSRQGAGWPVDVVVIEGRGKTDRSKLKLPGAKAPKLFSSWDELKKEFVDEGQERGGVGSEAVEREGERDLRAGGVREADGVGVPGAVDRAGAEADRRGPGDGAVADGDRAGSGLGGDDVRPEGLGAGAAEGLGAGGELLPDEVPSVSSGAEPEQAGGEKAAEVPAVGDELRGLVQDSADEELKKLFHDFISDSTALSFIPTPAKLEKAAQIMAVLVKQGFTSFRAAARKAYAVAKDEIVPYLKEAWERARALVGELAKKMSSTDEVEFVDLDAILADLNPNASEVYQLPSKPRSKVPYKLNTLAPRLMQRALDQTLAEVESRVGDIDEYVRNELGFTKERFDASFAAEQVDALALAFDNLARKEGFVIGDMTGVGKGRVVSGVVLWARKRGLTPIFFTAKPGLYADLIRDMEDIGEKEFKPFITNTNLGKLETDSERILKTEKLTDRARIEAHILKTGSLPDDREAVFTTYDQINFGGVKPTGDEIERSRHPLIDSLAPGALFILDESHLAAGNPAVRKVDKKIIRSRSMWLKEKLAQSPNGAFYSSATWAKNPHSMLLYFKTAMGRVVDDPAQLMATLKRGGVPLQQVLSTMMIRAGQYIRRELSFVGVKMDLNVIPVDADAVESATDAMRAIFLFDKETMKDVRETFIDEIAGEGSGGIYKGDEIEKPGELPFQSQMHNLVKNLMLAIKSKAAAQHVIDAIRRGEKPVVALSQTFGAMLENYIAEEGLAIGSDMSKFTFNFAFKRYLNNSRKIRIKPAHGDAYYETITDEWMLAHGFERQLAEFQEMKNLIEDLDLSAFSVSPIDTIINDVKAAGFSIGEITGRPHTITTTGKLADRQHSSSRAKKTIKRFNNDEDDYTQPGAREGHQALIINRSGATGYSMHASTKFKNQRVRHMLILEADDNVNDYMQMLGRVKRSGEKQPPKYTMLVSNMPSEKRPAALLMKRMSLLSAATTANKDGAMSLKDVTDVYNEVGDELVFDLLKEDKYLSELFMDRQLSDANKEDIARKVTGRMAILSIAQQEALWAKIRKLFVAKIEELDAIGKNPLMAQVIDLRAKTLSTQEIVKGRDGGTPFDESAVLEVVQVRRLNPPLTIDQITKAVTDRYFTAHEQKMHGIFLKPKGSSVTRMAQAKGADERLALKEKYRTARNAQDLEDQERLEALEAISTEGMTHAQAVRHERKKQHLREQISARAEADQLLYQALDRTTPLERYTISKTKEGQSPDDESADKFHAIIAGVEYVGGESDAHRPSSYAIVMYTNEGTAPIKFSLAGLTSKRYEMAFTPSDVSQEAFNTDSPKATTEERQIITGNLFAGFSEARTGKFVMYSNSKGEQREGILMPRSFDIGKMREARNVKLSPKQVVEFLLRVRPGIRVSAEDGGLDISISGGRLRERVVDNHKVTRVEGGHFLIEAVGYKGKRYERLPTAREILGDFSGRRGSNPSVTTEDADALVKALEQYIEHLDAEFVARTEREIAREVAGARIAEKKVVAEKDKEEPPKTAQGLPAYSAPADAPPLDPRTTDEEDDEVAENAIETQLNSVDFDTSPGEIPPKGIELEAQPGFEKGKLVDEEQIIKAAEWITEVVSRRIPIRFGRIKGKRRQGYFAVWQEIIRQKRASGISTAYHEIGHAVEKLVYGWKSGGKDNPWTTKRVGRIARGELMQLGKDLYGSKRPNGGYRREGWAEFFRILCVEGNAEAQAKAPELYKWFREKFVPIAGSYRLTSAVERAQQLVERFKKQGSVRRALAKVRDPSGMREKIVSLGRSFVRSVSAFELLSEGAPLGVMLREARMLGHAVTEGQDPHAVFLSRQGTAPGIVKTMLERGMVDIYGRFTGAKSLMDVKGLIEGKTDEFVVYLWARRAKALHEEGKGRYPGLPYEDTMQILKELDSPQFDTAAGIVHEWNAGVLDYAAQASPVFDQIVRAIRKRDPGDYVPLQRWFTELDNAWATKRGGAQDNARVGRLVKHLHGSDRPVLDPLQTMISQAQRTVMAAHRRMVIDRIIQLGTLEGMGRVFEYVPRDTVPGATVSLLDALKRVRREYKMQGLEVVTDQAMRDAKLLDDQSLVEQSITFFAPAYAPKGQDPVIPIYANGQLRWAWVDPQLYRSLANADPSRLADGSFLWTLLTMHARFWRASITGASATFQLMKNPPRDFLLLMGRSQSDASAPRLFATWAWTMGQLALNRLTFGKYTNAWIDFYINSGMELTASYYAESGQMRHLRRRFGDYKVAGKVLPGQRVLHLIDPRNAWDAYLALIQWPEAGPRIAEMKLVARDLGWDPSKPLDEATHARLLRAGKEITIDFTDMGKAVRKWNQIVPFFNANLKGPVMWARLVPRLLNPETRYQTISRVVQGALPMIGLSLWLWWKYHDEDWFKEMDPMERLLNWHVPFEVNGEKHLLRIPMDPTVGMLLAVPQMALEQMRHEDPIQFEEWGKAVFSANMPPFVPPSGKEAAQQIGNRDFFWNSKIVSGALEGLPYEEQYTEYTSKAAIWLGKKGTEMFGESPAFSPVRIDHAIRGMAGRFVTDVIAFAGVGPAKSPREWELSDIPVLGASVQRGGELSGRLRTVTKLYELRDRADRLARSPEHEETVYEAQRRLMLQDATRAISAYGRARLQTAKMTDRQEISERILSVARDALRRHDLPGEDLQELGRGEIRLERAQAEALLREKQEQ